MYNIAKTSKLNLVKLQPNSIDSVKHVRPKAQSLRSQIVNVDAIGEEGDVIFTTVDGKETRISNSLRASDGDKVRIIKNEEGMYELVSIYEKFSSSQTLVKKTFVKPDISESLRLNPGEVILAELVDVEDSSSLISKSFDNNGIMKLLHSGQIYQLRVVSIDKDSAEDLEIKIGLVGILNEILSDESQGDYSFSCKVINNDQLKTTIGSEFGNFVVPKIYKNLTSGTNLILQLILDVPLNHASYSASINNWITNLDILRNMLSDEMKKQDDTSLASALVVLKKYVHKQGISQKNKDILEKLYVDGRLEHDEIINLKNVFDVFKEELRNSSNIVAKTSDLNQQWIAFYIPINQEDRKYNHKIYLQKTTPNIIRIITDISLSNIGEIQLDVLILLEKEDYKKEFVVKNIDLKIRHKSKIQEDFFQIVSSSFQKSNSAFDIKSTIMFEETQNFSDDPVNNTVKKEIATSLNRRHHIVLKC